jgi:hypothetical protein
MHTDNGDIVSLYTLQRSLSGGSTYLSNVQETFSQLQTLRPDLAKVLTEDWVMMR